MRAIALLVLTGLSCSAQHPLSSILARHSTSVEGFLHIPVIENGHSFWCDLDSGGSAVFSLDTAKGAGYYSGVLMRLAIGQSNVLRHVDEAGRRPDHPKGTGGEVTINSTRPEHLRVGSISIDQPIVGLIETELAGVPWVGLVGAGF